VLLVYLQALFTYLFPPSLSHRPLHPETDSVGAVPFVILTLKRARKSTNYKHDNTGSGLSYSGRNGQLSLPY